MSFRLLRLIGSVLPLVVALSSDANAQTLQLRTAGSGTDPIAAQVGDIVNLEVFADLGNVKSAGIAVYIGVPDGFQIVDLGNRLQEGTQPFAPGPLFDGALVAANQLLPEDVAPAAAMAGQQLDYGGIYGPGANRTVSGSGVVATFSLLCIKAAQKAVISIEDNPVRETKLVLTDGISEKRFLTVQGMDIAVEHATGTAVAPATWGLVKHSVR